MVVVHAINKRTGRCLITKADEGQPWWAENIVKEEDWICQSTGNKSIICYKKEQPPQKSGTVEG